MPIRKDLLPAPFDLIGELRAANDRLGAYSDHEGQEYGSTYYFWCKGQAEFDLQCDRAIEDHRAAIAIWSKLRRTNKRREYKRREYADS